MDFGSCLVVIFRRMDFVSSALALSVAMVFAMRVVLDMGLWSFVMVRSAADGVLHFNPFPSILETCVLFAVSEFGNLFCYAALAGVSRSWHRKLSLALGCFRERLRLGCDPLDVCQDCEDYGVPHLPGLQCGSGFR